MAQHSKLAPKITQFGGLPNQFCFKVPVRLSAHVEANFGGLGGGSRWSLALLRHPLT